MKACGDLDGMHFGGVPETLINPSYTPARDLFMTSMSYAET